MNRGETKLWRNKLRFRFHQMGHVDRIESHSTALGRPDVNICLPGGCVWDVELKYCGIVRRGIVIRPSQRAWIKQRTAVGGNVAIFTHVQSGGRDLYVFNIVFPLTTHVEDWVSSARIVWHDKINFNELEEVLYEKK